MSDAPLALVIDDDVIFRKTFEVVLPRLGLKVRTTENPSEFIRLATELKPDLHLIDLHLAGTKGFELIQLIRMDAPEAVIIVISGDHEPQSIAHALELGANDFILKPLDRALLASKLARFVDTERIQDQKSGETRPPEGRATARLSVDMELTELDELGVQLRSRHLTPKGGVLQLKTEFLQAVGITDDEVLVTVMATRLDPESGYYFAYAEFDATDSALLEAVRRWMRRA